MNHDIISNDIKSIVGNLLNDHANDIIDNDMHIVHSYMLFFVKSMVEFKKGTSLIAMGPDVVSCMKLPKSCRWYIDGGITRKANVSWLKASELFTKAHHYDIDMASEEYALAWRDYIECNLTRLLYNKNSEAYFNDVKALYGNPKLNGE